MNVRELINKLDGIDKDRSVRISYDNPANSQDIAGIWLNVEEGGYAVVLTAISGYNDPIL